MIDPEIKRKLHDEAVRIRDKYHPSTTDDLVTIAREEFKANEVRHMPSLLKSKVIHTHDYTEVWYNSFFPPYERLAIGHELGHLAAGHFDGHKPGEVLQRRWKQTIFLLH